MPSIPPEYAWIVPLAIPLVIGLLVGVIVRRTIKLIAAITALVLVLVATGYISLTFQDVYAKALEVLPKLVGSGLPFLDVIPYSSATFLIGLALGLWKG